MIGAEMKDKAEGIVKKCLDNGLLINLTAEKVIRFLPPLTIESGIIDDAAEVLARVIKDEN